jgi:Ca2+-binding EF-hand superfamily protein
MREAFDYFDKDGTGFITKAELGAMMRMLGMNMSKTELQRIMDDIDADGNGLMDFSEFLQLSTRSKLMKALERETPLDALSMSTQAMRMTF